MAELVGALVEHALCKFREFLDHAFEERAANADDAHAVNGFCPARTLVFRKKSRLAQQCALTDALDFLKAVRGPRLQADRAAGDYQTAIGAVALIEQALAEAAAQKIAAKQVTPFLLQRIFELTEGRSLQSNIALVLNNARLAAEISDVPVINGGDGTVREVCAELAGTGIPVGIVPAGTGNLLARNLDIPLYLRAAIDVGLTGQDRAIDMVEVAGDGLEDSHFMVMAGMGFDAAIMEGVNEDIKKRVGWLAYVLSGLKSLMFPAMKVEISVDGAEFTKHRARTVVVGNVDQANPKAGQLIAAFGITTG